ncbi:YjjG family noncanonical pyrimidine nucleotidase [Periweissella fabaria]|uniref:HAD-hydrolase YfnB n=1 Tax=Periweissella fabaria TaxID=546157 RepID=A0ABN8BFE4_9LACO|nr:YjjG family noncanonical pyrimidine nucleotidase [Periweissella fabaria]MCM0596624.1 YjjG family noncanonical pyrimidine nucleotidase [Periweissella fabaria]CAH0416451.1 Putative HAD-hydrolase YfnB [Periweissella fabaria]
MYKALLFDLDDTLLDFKAAEDFAFKQLMQESNVPYTQQLFVQYDEINQQLWRQLERQEITKQYLLDQRFTRFFAALGYDNLDGIAAERRFRQLLGEGAFLMPNAKETLTVLKHAGYQLYTASNGVYQTQIRRMQATQILDFFDGHFISETVGYEKPNVKFFEYILNELKITKQDVLMIGDGLNSDIKGALASDIDCVYYDYANRQQANDAQYTVTDLLDLPSVF